MSLCMRKQIIWVPTRSDTNRTVQSQKMLEAGNFGVEKVEEVYYPCSENKGADQLRSLFSSMQIVCFPMRRLIFNYGSLFQHHIR